MPCLCCLIQLIHANSQQILESFMRAKLCRACIERQHPFIHAPSPALPHQSQPQTHFPLPNPGFSSLSMQGGLLMWTPLPLQRGSPPPAKSCRLAGLTHVSHTLLQLLGSKEWACWGLPVHPSTPRPAAEAFWTTHTPPGEDLGLKGFPDLLISHSARRSASSTSEPQQQEP